MVGASRFALKPRPKAVTVDASPQRLAWHKTKHTHTHTHTHTFKLMHLCRRNIMTRTKSRAEKELHPSAPRPLTPLLTRKTTDSTIRTSCRSHQPQKKVKQKKTSPRIRREHGRYAPTSVSTTRRYLANHEETQSHHTFLRCRKDSLSTAGSACMRPH